MSGQRKRGFAALNPEHQRAIARKGGKAAHGKGTAHEFSSEEARRAGQLGGKVVSANRAHMAAIGRKGGQHSVQRAASARAAKQLDDGTDTVNGSSANSSTSSSVMVERLRADHQRVNTLFHQYEFGDPTPAARTVILRKICGELLRHTTFEEEMVYPIVRQELAESEQHLVRNSVRAHERMKELLKQLDGRTSEETNVNDLVRELQTCVQHHVEEEEQEILPKLEERTEGDVPRLGPMRHVNMQENDQSSVAESREDTSAVPH